MTRVSRREARTQEAWTQVRTGATEDAGAPVKHSGQPSGEALLVRPAFYALRQTGWRDYVTLLHPPYTAWHLSYVAVGASLAPDFHPVRLWAALAAFFLAVGIGAHALDELNGRPLGTAIPKRKLLAAATASLAAAAGIGVAGAVAYDLWLLPFVAVGVVLVCAYNLEWAGGRLHNDGGFALAWGGFPALTGYFAEAGTFRAEALIAAVFAVCLSVAQRRLSTFARRIRRQVTSVSGSLEHADGRREELTAETLLAPPEAALRALAAAVAALAVALVVFRLA